MKRSRFTLGPRQEASPVSPKRKLQKYQTATTTAVTTTTTTSPIKTRTITNKEEPVEREIKPGKEEEEEEEEEEEVQEYEGNKSRDQLQIEYNSILNERDMLLNQYSRLIETQMSQE